MSKFQPSAYSQHNPGIRMGSGVRVVVPPVSSFHPNPSSYSPQYLDYTPTSPTSPTVGLTKGMQTAALVGGVALVPVLLIGALLFMPLVVNPLIIKAFKPKWSYGRRVVVGIPLGIMMGLGVTLTQKLAASKG
jgi:hypothetical protein